MRKFAIAAALAAATISTASIAAVIFDSESGTGFVGKGDVQLAFGWNNKALQTNASGVTFGYDAQDTYVVECYWETVTGQGKIVPHDLTIPRHTNVIATLDGDPRQTKGQNQFTGFILSGFGSSSTSGTVPEVGGDCPGASSVATVVSVSLVSSTGGLTATSGGVTKPL